MDDRRSGDSRGGRPYGDRPRQGSSGGERSEGDRRRNERGRDDRGRQGSGFGRSDERRGGDDRRGSADRSGNEDRRGNRPGYPERSNRSSDDRRASEDRRPRDGNRGGHGTERHGGGADRRSGGSDRRGSGPDRHSGGAPRRRGGEGGFDPQGREGVRPQRREARPDEPDLPDDIEASELDPTIRRDLLSLDKANANAVARHLVMAGRLIDDDPRTALSHARAARQRAGRIAVVREAAGITAYHAGEWAEALSELRAARRMSGGTGLLAVMADCERGLGRPEKAVELGRSEDARKLTGEEASELRIVVAGARMDLGQIDQAVVTLQTPDLDPERVGTPAARLFYAYADALVAAGRTDEGLQWFLHSAAADLEGVTDAEDRVEELTGDHR
ncbi:MULTISPECIES: tetratricopeptide repeat protein [unclassified Rhodococcus (in: high G+C Gram-positive bacteria)]|uniref:tetratricopeptide repeat protein n=1 Tax=Rhodococcus sp. SJ-3 TaxID=3454628 RepID=UPI003F7A8A70